LRALEHRHRAAFAGEQRIAGEQVGAPGLVVVRREVELVDAVARRVTDRERADVTAAAAAATAASGRRSTAATAHATAARGLRSAACGEHEQESESFLHGGLTPPES